MITPTIYSLAAMPAPLMIGLRIVVIIAALGLWFLTQALLAKRGTPTESGNSVICDGIHTLTAKWNRWLLDNPSRANRLLMCSSLGIDLLGIYLLTSSVIGPTFQPFLGLLMLFALRQICQAFCPLPLPEGMIWRDPGFPAFLVTYGTSNDLFFSGHTAIAVFGSLCLGHAFGAIGIVIGILIAIFEVTAVLILRAHYTMDVFTGAIAALYVYDISWKLAPMVDQWLAHVVMK
jgi:hypothetical protein